jgi:hypothetical protein
VGETVELEGTLATYGWINRSYDQVQYKTVLLTASPVSLVTSDGKLRLRDALLFYIPARDDAMLIDFGSLIGKRVRVTCEVNTSSLFGFAHGFWGPVSIAPTSHKEF